MNYFAYAGLDVHTSKDLESLLEKYCKLTNTTPEEIKANSRKMDIREKRQVFHYIAHVYCRYGSADVGKITNRDHATTLHSCKKVIQQDYFYKPILDELLPHFRAERLDNINKLIKLGKYFENN